MMRLTAACRLALPFVIIMSSAASAESIKDFWSERSAFATFPSAKTTLALEYCLGLTASEYGTPITLHGEGVTIVSIIYAGTIEIPLMGFRLSEKDGHRLVEAFARGSATGNYVKLSRRTAESCA